MAAACSGGDEDQSTSATSAGAEAPISEPLSGPMTAGRTSAPATTASASLNSGAMGSYQELAQVALDRRTFDDRGFEAADGKAIYAAVCAGCHMPDGSGAVGGAAYPALKDNGNLSFPQYPISMTLNGRKGMPPIGPYLSDEQVVALVNYLQADMNDFDAAATVEMVASMRTPQNRYVRGEPDETPGIVLVADMASTGDQRTAPPASAPKPDAPAPQPSAPQAETSSANAAQAATSSEQSAPSASETSPSAPADSAPSASSTSRPSGGPRAALGMSDAEFDRMMRDNLVVRHKIPNSDFPILLAVEVRPTASLVYLSGTVPQVINEEAPRGSPEAYGDTTDQTVSTLQSIETKLEGLGLTMSDVIKMQVFLVKPEGAATMDFGGFMEGYTQFFGTEEQPNLPTRSVLEVAGLANPSWLVEIEVVAVR
ncbi:TdcF protein [Parvularcula bermudensis HTCC2503]|uniref:TdcF protein n=2 Tax=Parvularcula TaxID=208215 RepID=E0TGD2_PARBH|nr:TdcF protein [Parvularcula bermudensis HTCC2503]